MSGSEINASKQATDFADQYDSIVVQPIKIPRLSREEKLRMIVETGQVPFHHSYSPKERRARKKVLRNTRLNSLRKSNGSVSFIWKPLYALPIADCPTHFDAVTRARNGRTYLFTSNRVYQVWRQYGLHQRSSYLINEMFPGGPQTVTVAYTNFRSGITMLIGHAKVYRFRWIKKTKSFKLARKSPQTLNMSLNLLPRVGFQWIDGNQILVEREFFITYDAYWNLPTFHGLISNYFPNLPSDMIGLAYHDESSFLVYTESNKILVYNLKKYRIAQEIPVNVGEYVGCKHETT